MAASRKPQSKKPRKLRPEEVIALALRCGAGESGTCLHYTAHLWKDHPERQIQYGHLLQGLANPEMWLDRKDDRYSERHRKWAYLIQTSIAGHSLYICVAFDPPLPNANDNVIMEIVTAHFPDEEDGGLPESLR